MFSVKGGRGFRISFRNGYTVSVQFGIGNYCDNQYEKSPLSLVEQLREPTKDSPTAETALTTDAGLVLYKGRQVQGYQNAKDVLELLAYAENLPNPKEKE